LRLSLNGFVKNLKAFSKISSLAAVQLPVFELEDSESQKLFKTLDIEFNSPRKQLDLFISVNNEWNQVGSASLLNPSGYPYRMYNLMDFYTDNSAAELGENGKIGVKISDVGYGLLTGNDTVTIHGSYIQEFVFADSYEDPILDSNSFPATIGTSRITATTEKTLLIPANIARLGTTIWNNSSSYLLLDFDMGNSAPALKLSPEAYYEVPFGYLGDISGRWESANGQAEIREFLP
jgi:hypothetical protein